MASPKARKGAVAGALAGLAAVAAAVALTAAVPAPAPAEPAAPVVEEAVSEVGSILAGLGGMAHEYGGSGASEAGPALSARHDGGSPATSSGSASSGIGGSSPEASLNGDPIPEAAQESLQTVESADNGGARERHWVVDYETVWVPSIETVVDAPEREEPVYESHDVLVCNACGYSTESGNAMGSHLSQHAVQGVDEGYCSVVEQVQVGTRTVPAVCHEVDNGHYEVRESGGHWE